jgi:glycerol-3-phosphate dehydrogenase
VKQSRYDVAVIGAGVVGTAIARALSGLTCSTVVIERSKDIGDATSKANTAILHTGFDCVPGTLESRLVQRGYTLLDAYARDAGIAVERTGAVLVAWDARQLEALPGLQTKARENGYLKTALIGADEVYQLEPQLGPGALGGLVVPDESIIDPWSPPLAFARDALANGVVFLLDTEVQSIAKTDDGHVLATSGGPVLTTWVINAAGLSSGVLNERCGHHDFTVTPRRGELLVFDKLARSLVQRIILPVPTAVTKGVLISPTVFGNVLLGPTADDIDDPIATGTTPDGLQRLMAAGAAMMPRLVLEEVTATYAGLRAATEHRDYQIHLHPTERYLCVGGIRSTGLTASLAIGEYVLEQLGAAGFAPPARPGGVSTTTMAPLGEAQLRPYQDDQRIAGDNAYGTIICHCERVSEGEVRDALANSFAPHALGALRRQTRVMNGRCQGFYCAARVVAMMAEATGVDVATLTGLDS